MRRRATNNAAGIAFAAVAFVLTGCVIAVWGAIAGFDAGVRKFAIVAYVCVAGALFLASLAGVGLSNHRSFRATPPAYMEGKRVKPRLWWLATTCDLTAIAAMLMAFVCVISAGSRFEGLAARAPWMAHILFIVIPPFVYALARMTFTFIAMSLGLATRQQAGELLTKGVRWPETWLEPMDGETKE